MEANVQTSAEPVIRLTESAAQQVRHLQAEKPENVGKTLRIFVEDGGCSGMQYGMVFDEPRENDHSTQHFGVTVLVDPFSATYIQGTIVDYIDALTGGGFKISNPKARHSCGCGKSFEA
jgi:iron-sulfur cluster assembly protein